MAELYTNVDARATKTIAWLASPETVLAVPVYQRHYRWTVAVGGRLLSDVRQVADADATQTHFIGSILASRSVEDGDELLTLIDGQQRIVTLTLLLAALRQTVRETDPGLGEQLTSILEHPRIRGRTRVRPHRSGLVVLDGLVFGRPVSVTDEARTLYDENYAYFLEEISHDAPRVWKGLQRLEHVTVALKEHANPQQIFESMNATGAPLKSDELIHNYVLMGLTHDQQLEVEDDVWTNIEANTGQLVEEFFRDYLVLKTWRDDHFKGERGVYDVFKEQFTTLTFERLRDREAPEWLRYSAIYRLLLAPASEPDTELARELRYVGTFGRSMYPLLLGVYDQFRLGAVTRAELLEVLGLLQSLFIRKMVVGESRDGLIARLCRTWGRSRNVDRLRADIASRTPSDERVRSALLYRLPQAGYVLSRLDDRDNLDGVEIEHIFPVAPTSAWRGCENDKSWGERSEEEKSRLRELLNTLGNLTLLEQPLNAGAGNLSFHKKQEDYYSRSGIAAVQKLTTLSCWGAAEILERTAELTSSFLEVWARPPIAGVDGIGHLIGILDVPRRPGYYPGWATEFDYAIFREEILEVRNIKQLYFQVVKRLLEERYDEVLTFNRGTLRAVAEHAQYELIAPGLYVNMAIFPQYLLKELQDLLDDLDLADTLQVKFSADSADEDAGEALTENDDEAADDRTRP
ncbi:MAG: DUF262 domain-containing protein [Micrococcales bacterium]|nr:DUF262 domain-containing protein [Micrococcales bacterium]